jgi:hypothetical protein
LMLPRMTASTWFCRPCGFISMSPMFSCTGVLYSMNWPSSLSTRYVFMMLLSFVFFVVVFFFAKTLSFLFGFQILEIIPEKKELFLKTKLNFAHEQNKQ